MLPGVVDVVSFIVIENILKIFWVKDQKDLYTSPKIRQDKNVVYYKKI